MITTGLTRSMIVVGPWRHQPDIGTVDSRANTQIMAWMVVESLVTPMTWSSREKSYRHKLSLFIQPSNETVSFLKMSEPSSFEKQLIVLNLLCKWKNNTFIKS